MLSNHVGTTNSFDRAELHFNVQFHSHNLHIVGHRCCARKTATQPRADLKRSKRYILRTAKKPGKSDFDGYGDVNVVSNSNRNGSRERKNLHFRDRLDARRFDEKTKMSEASQTINDTKSTVVMEFSTVQKVVQIVDNDSDVNSIRPPFKDIVIQKDTTDRKRDYNVEHNFESNLTAAENP
ncbi:histidine kinase [Lasius niger]|uniref:Histidine kinase n=1 Tax=Lasius niger TaxID=67767 RepID=A0A0J7P2U4_LASNI|nr:histidine kinase [Lasius niger]